MNYIDNFFVFPQAINVDGKLKCNISENSFKVCYQSYSCEVKLLSLPQNSTTMLLYDESIGFIQIDEWENTVSQAKVTSQAALNYLRRACFIQIDHYQTQYFTKVFLPIRQLVLESDTHDFTFHSCFPIDFLHPIDWHYQITADLLSANIKDGILTVVVDVVPSVLFTGDMYLNYTTQAIKLVKGKNNITLPYSQGNLMHFGHKPYYKGMGNCIKVENYLEI